MDKKSLLLLMFSIFLFSNCNEDKDKLIGYWGVRELRITNYGVVEMANNDISFYKDNICHLPVINNWYDPRAVNWEFVKDGNNKYIIIRSNNIFGGRYLYSFYDNVNKKQFEMRLTSDSVDMVCFKLEKYDK